MAGSLTRHIPNTITCMNLFSGCIACIMAFEAHYKLAFLFIVIGAVFDFLDGLVARALKAYSSIGKELDSLADDITFGLAPALMVYTYLCGAAMPGPPAGAEKYIPYFAFLLAVFSALRLAKFNVDERQTSSFIGLPTPANALFWSSLIVGLAARQDISSIYTVVLIGLIFFFSWLMNAEIPMFSMKFRNLSWKDNKVVYIFLVVSIFLLIWLKIEGIAAVILWYILLSFLTARKK
ncbi:MAG: CDP-diacylglycerol--serine O-phosphatidyltransferase [Bacteroides sp.]|nr:CDP-diacylglycerol--serine O-phosphatidyltransferase [Bacteroides sp.]